MSSPSAPERNTGRDLAWLASLGIALPLQIVASFATQIVVVIGPVTAEAADIPPQSVGMIAASVSAGTLIFLIFGMPFLKRFGVFPVLVTGLAACSAALAMTSIVWWPSMILAAVLLGMGYGPVPPSGSRILAKSAPARHRSLIFSIKQAGAPFGTAVAGLVMPFLILAFGWQSALWCAAGATLLFAIALLPFRNSIEGGESGDRGIRLMSSFNLSLLSKPVALLSGHTELRGISLLAISCALAQGIVFANFVIFLDQKGLDFASATAAYAACQAGGVSARLVVGWIADRIGAAATTMRMQAALASVALIAFAFLTQPGSFELDLLLAFVLGSLVASWNGLYLAEVARLVPLKEVPEATAAATTALFIAYAVGPPLFAILLSFLGNWHWAWGILGGFLFLAAVPRSGSR